MAQLLLRCCISTPKPKPLYTAYPYTEVKMKKQILILCMICFGFCGAEGTVVKYRINKNNNSILTNNILFNLHQGFDGKVWINTNSHLIQSTSAECIDWVDYSDSIKNNLLFKDFSQYPEPNFRSNNMMNDRFGNMIFHTSGGLGVFYIEDGSWDFFTRDNPDLPKYRRVVLNNDIECDIDANRIYVSGHRDTMYYAQYEFANKRYHYEDLGGSQYLVLPDSSLDVKEFNISGDTIWILTRKYMLLYDKRTEVFTIIDNQKIDNGLDFFNLIGNSAENSMRLMYNSADYTRFIFHNFHYDYDQINHKMLTDDSIIEVLVDSNAITHIEEIKLDKTLKYSQKRFYSFVDLDNSYDSLLIGNWSEMWLYNINSGELSQIPRPKEFEVDPNQEWAAQNILVIPERNELWLGNSNVGILICDLKKVIDSAISLGVVDSNVEINQRFPMLGCYQIYPQPSTGYSNIELYQQEGDVSEITAKVYDINGANVYVPEIEIVKTVGMRRKASIATSHLASGVYIVLFRYKEHVCSSKIIIN